MPPRGVGGGFLLSIIPAARGTILRSAPADGEGRHGSTRVGVPRVRAAVSGGADLRVRTLLRALGSGVRTRRPFRGNVAGSHRGRSCLHLALSGPPAGRPRAGVGSGAGIYSPCPSAPPRRGPGIAPPVSEGR